MDDAMRGRARAAQSSMAALEAKNAGVAGRAECSERWRRVGARVLPVFTGERLQGTVEEGTEVVRSCLRSSDSLDGVWAEIHAMLRVGMASLVRIVYRQVGAAPRYDGPRVKMPSAALVAECARPDAVAEALASVWELVTGHVLPCLEGVFLPLVQFGVATYTGANSVRGAVLLHFRDALVVPLLPTLDEAARLHHTPCLPVVLHMMTLLAALTPADRSGPVYATARALAAAVQQA
ncbi:hypothetical protein H4R19_003634 [Coemansia spiralis]|nr:hypothetical protein H4R19_003634 [Coemansia spiralis]